MRLGLNKITAERFVRLISGLFVFGVGIAMMVHAKIGISPWDVLAQGISIQTRLSFGISVIIVSVFVLLAWIPLKQKPGIGTVANAVLIGLFADLVGPWLPEVTIWWEQLLMFVVGMLVLAFATGLYISAGLGSGPRDGLMVGTHKALGWPLWLVRTIYEGSALTIGWLLGGQVGLGTLIFAVCIGYLMQSSMKLFGLQGKRKPKYPIAETGE